MTAPKRKRECYARVAVQLRTHDRARIAEHVCPGAMGMFTFLLIQARGEESDGTVLELAAIDSWGGPTAYRRKQIAALRQAGLIEIDAGVITIVRYDEHNDSPDVIEANRSKARDRMADVRANKPRTEHAVPSSSSISKRDSERDREPSGAPEAQVIAIGSAASEVTIAAYESAVSAVTGSPFVVGYRGPDRAQLVQLMATYCPGKPALEVADWLRASVTEWVTPRREQPEFASGFAPRGFEAWLRGGRKAPTQRAGPASIAPISQARRVVSNEPTWKQNQ